MPKIPKKEVNDIIDSEMTYPSWIDEKDVDDEFDILYHGLNEFILTTGALPFNYYPGSVTTELINEDELVMSYSYGLKMYTKSNSIHRIDGPAVILPDGEGFYYLHGRWVTESEFNFYKELK